MLERTLIKTKIFEDLGKYYFPEETSHLDNKVSFNLTCKYPLWIIDDKKKERQLKLLNFKNLASVELEANIFTRTSKTRLSKFIDVVQLTSNLNNELTRLRLRHEDIVLNSTYDKLVKIPAVENTLSPMYTILGTIIKKGKLEKELIYNSKKSAQLIKYLKLLENLEFIEKKGLVYIEGNISKSIQKDLESEAQQKVITKILGSVVKGGFKYLTEELKLFALIPYVRLATSYYSNCLSANELIYINKNRFPFHYDNLYHRRVKFADITPQLDRLNDVNILNVNQDDSLVYGCKNLFEEMENNYSTFFSQ